MLSPSQPSVLWTPHPKQIRFYERLSGGGKMYSCLSPDIVQSVVLLFRHIQVKLKLVGASIAQRSVVIKIPLLSQDNQFLQKLRLKKDKNPGTLRDGDILNQDQAEININYSTNPIIKTQM